MQSLPLNYDIIAIAGGDPIEPLAAYRLITRDDKDLLPTVNVTIDFEGVPTQFLAWYYNYKGEDLWKICRIRTYTRSYAYEAGPTPRTIPYTEQVVSYPNGLDTYDFDLKAMFNYSYLPKRN